MPALAEGYSVEYYIQAFDASSEFNSAQTAISRFTVEAPIIPIYPLPAPDPYLIIGYGLSGLAVILAIDALIFFTVLARKNNRKLNE